MSTVTVIGDTGIACERLPKSLANLKETRMSHRRTLSLALGLGIALATVLGSASVAQAQYAPGYYPPPPPPPPPYRGVYRGGIVWGFSLGAGGLTMPDCGQVCGAVGMGEFHIGGMIAPRLAVMGDFWESFRYFTDNNIGSGEIYNGIYTAAAQYWVNDIIWIKGGIGLGYVQINLPTYNGYSATFNSDQGFAFMLAAGLEIVQSYNFALDLQLRYGNAFYTPRSSGGDGDANEFGFMVGFNWY
jgi:hypothetical protein